jgi:hypothetical protein
LTKVADDATMEHWKKLLHHIRFVITTEYLALKLKPDTEESFFEMDGITDSEFGADEETRISVFGYVVNFCKALVSWKSRAGRNVTLSSTEAEYFALSEVTKEIMFVKQVLHTMGIVIKLPILVKVDNVGAIYLSNNFSLGQRTNILTLKVILLENLWRMVF